MSKKYYADINLYFDKRKYSIVGDTTLKKKELIELVEDFAKDLKLTCNTKIKKFFDNNGKEMGTYEINSREF